MDIAEERSYESVLNFPPDRSDIDSVCTKEGESDAICGDIDTEDTGNEDEKINICLTVGWKLKIVS